MKAVPSCQLPVAGEPDELTVICAYVWEYARNHFFGGVVNKTTLRLAAECLLQDPQRQTSGGIPYTLRTRAFLNGIIDEAEGVDAASVSPLSAADFDRWWRQRCPGSERQPL